MRSQISSVFEDVRAAAAGAQTVVRRRLGGARLDLYFVAGTGSEMHLALGVEATRQLPEKLPGSRFIDMRDAPIPGLGRRGLILTLVAREYADLFLVVCTDIVERLEGCDTVRAPAEFIVIVQRWQRFFERSADGMSAERQRGLFAELMFVRHLIEAGSPLSVLCEWWSGPAGERQDFRHRSVAVEIKSVSSAPPLLAQISGERQLDFAGRLFLVCYLLDPGTMGESLPALVVALRGLFGADPAAAIMFEERLVSVGYSDIHAAKYTVAYSVRDVLCFVVHSDFPRILESELRNGVSRVKYSIELDACDAYRTDLQALTIDFQEGEP